MKYMKYIYIYIESCKQLWRCVQGSKPPLCVRKGPALKGPAHKGTGAHKDISFMFSPTALSLLSALKILNQ